MSAQKYSTQIERAFKLLKNKIILIDKKKFTKILNISKISITMLASFIGELQRPGIRKVQF